MGQPIAKFLEEFPGDVAQYADVSLHQVRPQSSRSADPAPSIDARLAEAYARGRTEAEAAEKAHYEQWQIEQIAEFGRQLEASKQAFSASVAADLARELPLLVERLGDTLADQAAAALMPVLRHALTEAAVRELADGIRELVADGRSVVVELGGPEELIARVWESYRCKGDPHLESRGPAVKFLPGEGFDLRARVNDSIIETRLMEWVARVMGAAG